MDECEGRGVRRAIAEVAWRVGHAHDLCYDPRWGCIKGAWGMGGRGECVAGPRAVCKGAGRVAAGERMGNAHDLRCRPGCASRR